MNAKMNPDGRRLWVEGQDQNGTNRHFLGLSGGSP